MGTNTEGIKKYRFKPGQSGNPKGREYGSRNVKTILREFLSQPDHEDPDRTVLESTLLKVIAKARSGDLAAFNILMDRSEGKPTQHNVNENIETTYEDYLEGLSNEENI